MDWSKRSAQKEILDLGPEQYGQEQYEDCLKKLAWVGKLMGGNRVSLRAFSRLDRSPESILEVGCGGGHFTRLLATTYPSAQVVGIDLSPDAITYANKQPLPPNASFQLRTTPTLLDLEKSFDVVTTTLVCHHMSDAQLITFLHDATRVAKQAVIINDLHRSRWAYGSFALCAPLLLRNRIMVHDGLVSIQRSFRRRDWLSALKGAGLKPADYKVQWCFPFRWLVTIDPSCYATL